MPDTPPRPAAATRRPMLLQPEDIVPLTAEEAIEDFKALAAALEAADQAGRKEEPR